MPEWRPIDGWVERTVAEALSRRPPADLGGEVDEEQEVAPMSTENYPRIEQTPQPERKRVLGDVGASVVRTVVPVAVGAVASLALRAGVELPEGPLAELVTPVVAAAYYAAVRLAETRLGRVWGWLLGLARRPAYEVDRDLVARVVDDAIANLEARRRGVG